MPIPGSPAAGPGARPVTDPPLLAGRAASSPRRRWSARSKSLVAVGAVAVTTLVVLLLAVWVAPSWTGTGDRADTSAVPPPAPPIGSASGSTGITVPQAAPVTPAPVTVTTTVSEPPSAPATTTTSSSANAFGVPEQQITCGTGYIVQLASGSDPTAFAAQVVGLRNSGHVPAGAHLAQTAQSCQIFSAQSNSLVLYSGPFAGEYDGCSARLAGPADAYIKPADPATAKSFISCLCPAAIASLPVIGPASTGAWVGELQRVLGNKLKQKIGDLTGHWGTVTPATQAAVVAFQTAGGLPATGTVDAATWTALQAAACS